MLSAIREFRREAKARVKRQDYPHDEAGRAIIKMTVHDAAAFLSPYSQGATEVISGETAKFIRDSALGLPPKEEFSLHVYSDCIGDAEQKIYPDAIHSYFERNFADTAREMRLHAIQAIIMFVVGLIALSVMVVGEQLGWGEVWVECVDIFAWVFLWESVDIFFLERAALKRRAKRYLFLTKMNVEFFPLSELSEMKA